MDLAYARVVPTLAQADLEPLEPVNLNVSLVVTRILGAVPNILVHREALGRLDTFDVTQVDRLQDHVLALGHAYGLQRAQPEPTDDVPELVHAQRLIRERLRADAHALAKRGLLLESLLESLERSKSFRGVPFDVLALVELLLRNWETVGSKTAVTLAELHEARAEANRLLVALGKRKHLQRCVVRDDLLFRRLYTWVVRAYSDVRSAIRFIRRRQADAETIAPSIFPGPRKRSRRAGLNPAPTAVATPLAPAVPTLAPLR